MSIACETKYPSVYVTQWMFDCTQELSQTFLRQGYPTIYASRIAATHCGCVIDGVRNKFDYEDLIKKSPEKKMEAIEYETKICIERNVYL